MCSSGPSPADAAVIPPSRIARLVAAKVGFSAEMGGISSLLPSPTRSQLHHAGDPAHAHALTRAISTLRLVQEPRDAILRENLHAAALPDTDARHILALRVADTLEGGRLAMLRPERRRQLITHARRAGLRDFDAGLVIAIVQDAARRSEPLTHRDVVARLGMIAPPSPRTGDAPHTTPAPPRWTQTLLILSCTFILLAALIAWLMRT